MRKKLSTRFPAARIKKIMQADEEVGKIALATPVLISKALELFLQDLCDQTYNITQKKGAKTMSALHLRQCVQTNAVFDFLRETVSKVPDIGSDAHADERTGPRRRKLSDENDNDTEDEDNKRPKQEFSSSTSCRGRGRGRGRGRRAQNDAIKRNGYVAEKSDVEKSEEAETDMSDRSVQELSTSPVKVIEVETSAPTILAGKQPVRDFDLNMDPDENGDTAFPTENVQKDIVPKWPESSGSGFNVEALHLHLNHNRHYTQDEDDYDCEDDEDG
ncbi:hypothetical protein O6H91_05G129000 [Diphasiastrum complanatum]|uniref:Uncharacterized protein n=1 Tax=Diphasiastrum complanatum TaxID=34168 RepID=A0ACC2DTF7_DIPCM|nr:hypothetical protein O6H91_05G129000 [Diphasiastrum complanatum]